MKSCFIHSPADVITAADCIRQQTAIGIDTEFDNNRIRYGMTLCVVQIATPDECFILDPLHFAQEGKSEVLQPIWELVGDNRIEKVVFSGTEDLEIFSRFCQPQHFFDLGVAAKLLGMGYPSFGVLLKELLDKDINKSLQISDWYKRPFTPQMVDYLVNDVAFLVDMRAILADKLHQMGRWHWMEEEMEAILADTLAPSQEERLDKTATTKFHTHLLPDLEAYIIKQLLIVRDQYAQRYDLPTHYVFSNERLSELAKELPQLLELADWSGVKGLHRELRTTDNAAFVAELRVLYTTALQQGLSPTQNTQYAQRPAFELNKKELARFTHFFEPIKQYLAERYGTETQQILLSNNHIKKLFYARSLKSLRAYAVQEIIAAGQATDRDVAAAVARLGK